MKKLHQWFFVLCVFAPQLVCAQEAKYSDLYTEIMRMDNILFEAFNRQDLEKLKQLFDPELEFYHDTGGLSNYGQTIENSRKLFEKNTGLQRNLLLKSVEIYPIKNYGAIQTGKHRFCHIENNKNDCGTFKFLHVWKRIEGGWTLVRVVSYGH